MEQNYLGNPNLKKANVSQEWTKEEVQEYARCMSDPQYFIENYIMIVSLDEGLVPFKMYDFQKEMVGTFHNNRFTICKLPRQSGKIYNYYSIFTSLRSIQSIGQCLRYSLTKLRLPETC